MVPQFLDVDRNFAVIERQWAALIALCNDEAAFDSSAPSVSGWSVGQQVDHVGKENALIAGEIGDMLAHPEKGAGLAPTHPFAMRVLEQGGFPRGSGQAPMDVRPPAAVSREETRRLIESAKARWDALEPSRHAMQTSTATHPHPILGPFTCAQWLRFIPIHTAHHLKIIRDILDSAQVAAPYGQNLDEI